MLQHIKNLHIGGWAGGVLFLIGEGKPYLAKAPLSQSRHMKMAKQQPTVVPPMQNPLQRN